METVAGLTELSQIYHGKRVLLTGHTGFKGSWMLAWLKQLGASVYGLSLAPDTHPALFDLLNGSEWCKHQLGDIRTYGTVLNAVQEAQPDFIFHFAAQPLVRLGYETPVYTYETNLMGTVHLLEAVRQSGRPCSVVLITTDKVYENLENGHCYQESDQLGGYDPYSASKATCEIAISSYRRSYFNPNDYPKHRVAVASARAGNVIGGGDRSKDRIIPDTVAALEQGTPVVIRNPLSVRPWQHVLEPLAGYLQLGAALTKDPVRFATGYNFGPATEDVMNVRQVVETAISCWGSGSYETPSITGQPHEAGLLQLNSRKAHEELNWNPRWQSVDAVRVTIDWYRNAASDYRAFTLQQINDYIQL